MKNTIFGLKKRQDFWTEIILFSTFQVNVSSSLTSSATANKSAFPEIDIYIENLVKKDNGDGYIRKVQTSPCGWFLTYEFGNYRTCRNVGRAHKSNNVKLVVDLKANKVGQTCHDPDCKDFR